MAGEEKEVGIARLRKMMEMGMDGVEAALGQVKHGSEMVDELKDLSMTEIVELSMLALMRVPKMMDAFKKDPAE